MIETVNDIYLLLSKSYVLLMFGFVLDLFMGDPRWLPHPVRGIGWLVTNIEGFLRSNTQSKKRDERLSGIILVVIVAGLTYSLFYIFDRIIFSYRFLSPVNYLLFLVMVYLISTTLATRGLIDSARLVIEALRGTDIEAARKNLHHLVGRDTDSLDEKGILRATIESLAENASDGIIAPIFYFVIGGLPLAMTYKAINTMDSMIGYKNEKYRYFGWAAARLDDIANYIPARITGILIATASSILNWSLVTGHWSLKIMLRDGRKHLSLNSGVPEAAMAGALGIRLGGPSTYGGMVVNKPYIGIDKSEDFSERSTECSRRRLSRAVRSQELLLSASETAISVVKLTSVLGLGLAIMLQYMRITL